MLKTKKLTKILAVKNLFNLALISLLSLTSANLSFAESLAKNNFDIYTNSNQAPQANSWLSDANSSFNNQQEFLDVDEAFIADLLQDETKLNLIFNISDNYYLYRDSIKLIQKATGALVPLKLPKALDKTDEHYGATKIYLHQLVVDLEKSALTKNSILELKYQGCAEAGLCYPPQRRFLQIDASKNISLTKTLIEKAPQALVKESQLNQAKLNENTSQKASGAYGDPYSQALANKGLFTILAIFFAGGLLLAFTPCILPMLPIISALVVGKNKTKFQALNLSLAYVLGMALSYGLLGILSGALGGFLNLQTALQSAWVLVPFAVFFLLLSLPLFGVFELQLPSSWQEKIIGRQNKMSNRGGLITTGIIGFLAALVVSPCLSAPLVAALSFVAQSGNAGLGGLALFASGLGMGIPLIIFTTLGSAYLPKSGLWMEKIKNLFGAAMLFMALYMLRLWLSASLMLTLSGAILLIVAFIVFSKKRVALIAAAMIGIYALALILGGLMGNSSFLTPLKITHKSSHNSSSSASQLLANSATKTAKTWLKVAKLADLNKNLAASQGKTLVLISADWCANCKIVAKDILTDADLISATKDWNLIEFNTTNPKTEVSNFLQRKNIFGPPTFLFYKNNQEQENLRLQGIIDKLEILKRLNY